MATFKLPRLKANLAIVNGKGQPLDYFLRFWNIEVAPRIEQQEASQDQTLTDIADLQAQQAQQIALINQALELAGLALGQNSDTQSITDDVDSSGWTLGALVSYTGASPATVTVAGSGLYVGSSTAISPSAGTGQIRIVEVVSGVDTVIGGPWNFSAGRVTDPDLGVVAPYILNASEIAAFSYASGVSGDVSYRMDAITNSPMIITSAILTTTIRRA